MEEKEIYQQAVTLWGETFQMLMVIEECAELISAICKQFRGREDCSVVEEAVDVQLMLNQLRYIINDDEEWTTIMKEKLARLLARFVKGEE